MEINPQPLTGHWQEGYALDIHTISSFPLKDPEGNNILDVHGKIKWDTKYTPIGLEMNHFKYWKERHRAETIAVVAADWLQKKLSSWKPNLIIPIPPSDITRDFQPVYELATRIGARCNLPVNFDILRKVRLTNPQKEVIDIEQRKRELEGAFSMLPNSVFGKNVLVFDDLYRSGGTLNAVCDTIRAEGKAANVFVLTITKTRKNR